MQNRTKTAYLQISTSGSTWHGGPLWIVSLDMSHDLGRSLVDIFVYLYFSSVYYASIIPAPTLTKPDRRDEVFHTRAPECEPGRGTPHLDLSPREISSKTHGLLDYLNIVQANWGAFFSEGMELCKNTPQSLRHPCKSGENGVGEAEKRERLHTEDFCGQRVFALNPLKTSHCFREPFDVVFTLCVRLWCGLDEGYVNQTHKIPNRLLDSSISNAAVPHGTLERIVAKYRHAQPTNLRRRGKFATSCLFVLMRCGASDWPPIGDEGSTNAVERHRLFLGAGVRKVCRDSDVGKVCPLHSPVAWCIPALWVEERERGHVLKLYYCEYVCVVMLT